MKKFTLATAVGALALSATAAFASGPSVVVVEPPVYMPAPSHAYNWTGGYAGVGLTYGSGTHSIPAAFGVTAPNSTGPGLGVVMGYNWQNGNMVFGAEVAGVFSRMGGTNNCGIGPGIRCQSRINNFGAIRARVGVAMDNTLLFVTAGYATDTQRHTITVPGPIVIADEARRYNGPTVGVGIEHGFSNDWTVRGDLEHYRWGTRTFFQGIIPGGVPVTARTNLARVSIVRRF